MSCKKRCSTCGFAILDEYGYSNYTVEGVTVHCSINLNPHGEFDRWYGDDDRDSHAELCKKFNNNCESVYLDCDREFADRSKVGTHEYYDPYATEIVTSAKIEDIIR